MEIIYNIMETLLPFTFIKYDFIKNAILAIIIITPLFGMLGTLIVSNKMAFFSEALGHSAITGIAIGVVLGVSNTSLSMAVFAVVFALLLNKIKRKNNASSDTVISVFSSMSIAIGLAILSVGGNFGKYSSILVGDILSINTQEIGYLAIVFVITMIFLFTCFNSLHSMSINSTLAKSAGIKTEILDNAFAVIIALIVMLSIRWVGTLLINALLILPAASSRNISVNQREYHFMSVVFSMFSGILGLIISYYASTATGPTIVIIASIIFFATFLYSKAVNH